MTTLRAAAQQALEALEGGADSWQLVGPAIDALRAALAEPVQEPVAGRAFFERILAAMEGVIDVADRKTDEFDALRSCVIDLTLMLHTAPPQRPAEPVQEPVWVCPDSAEHRYGKPGHCEDCGKTLVQVAEPIECDPQEAVTDDPMSVYAEPVQDGCDHCNHPLYAAVKCRVCGRVTEPAEPVAYWNEDESSLAFKPGRGGRWTALYRAHGIT